MITNFMKLLIVKIIPLASTIGNVKRKLWEIYEC